MQYVTYHSNSIMKMLLSLDIHYFPETGSFTISRTTTVSSPSDRKKNIKPTSMCTNVNRRYTYNLIGCSRFLVPECMNSNEPGISHAVGSG